jgi:hypothetical protein
MFSGTMNRQHYAPGQSLRLLRMRRLERLPVRSKPCSNHYIAAHALVHSASDRLHLWQLWHQSIVEELALGKGRRSLSLLNRIL